MWAAHRPEQRRNILQLTALSSLQVDCTTRFAPCQGIFSASAAFSLWRGVRPASAVVLLTLSILPHVLRRVKGFSKFFSCRPSPLLPLIMYRAGVCRGMGGCWPGSSKLLLLQQYLWCCGGALARWDVMYLSHYLEKREYTKSYCCGGGVYWRYCLCGRV